jgi:hypothetical protein
LDAVLAHHRLQLGGQVIGVFCRRQPPVGKRLNAAHADGIDNQPLGLAAVTIHQHHRPVARVAALDGTRHHGGARIQPQQ